MYHGQTIFSQVMDFLPMHNYGKVHDVNILDELIPEPGAIYAFYGTSENAVKTQIWIAVSVYVLVAIIKKRHNLDQSLYTILQVLSITLFEKIPLYQILDTSDYKNKITSPYIQLKLFDI